MSTSQQAKRARRKARTDKRFRPKSGQRYDKANARAKANVGKSGKKGAG